MLKKEKSCETRSLTWPADPISSPATGGQWPVGRCPRTRAQPPPSGVLLLLVMVSVRPRWMCLHYILCVSTSSDRNVGRQDVTTNKFIVIAQSNFNNLLWIWKVPPYLNFDCIYYVNMQLICLICLKELTEQRNKILRKYLFGSLYKGHWINLYYLFI